MKDPTREARFERARQIIDPGGSNPVAVASALVHLSNEMLRDGAGMGDIRMDPALRLIAYQLASLYGVDGGFSHEDYMALYDKVVSNAKYKIIAIDETHELCGVDEAREFRIYGIYLFNAHQKTHGPSGNACRQLDFVGFRSLYWETAGADVVKEANDACQNAEQKHSISFMPIEQIDVYPQVSVEGFDGEMAGAKESPELAEAIHRLLHLCARDVERERKFITANDGQT